MPRLEDRSSPLESGTMTRPGVVLVIDDEQAIGHVLRVMLTSEHHVVVETRAAAALDRIARGERFDAILCDVIMPQATGPDFLDALRDRAPELAERVVFMTGGVTSPTIRARLVASGRPCIEKPFEFDQLLEILRALIVIGDRPQRAAQR
jgi:DNA-binding NtrC family response regulator